MRKSEVPRAEWKELLDHFSRVHRGWVVLVETSRGVAWPRVVADHMELAGISFEQGPHARGAIVITVGQEPGEHLTHTLPRPRRLILEQTDEGADLALRIASEGRETAVVRILRPALIEALDGLP